MSLTERLHQQAQEMVESGDPLRMMEAATLLKILSDIEQQHANTLKLNADRKKADQDLLNARSHFKDMLATSTPLFTTAILAGTLVFQIYQTHQAEVEKRAETARLSQVAEQTRFSDALKQISDSEKISPAATLLNSFTVEPQKGQARQMALKLLLRAKTADEFRELFSATIDPVGPADLPTLAQLDRSLAKRYQAIRTNYDPVTQKDDLTKLDAASLTARGMLADEIGFVSQRLSLLLQRAQPGGAPVDLSDVSIANADIQGAQLSGANLSNLNVTSAQMDNCDLSGITQFSNALFFYTAWWRAARISEPLLHYLEQTAPYREGTNYPAVPATSSADYAKNVARLRGQYWSMPRALP